MSVKLMAVVLSAFSSIGQNGTGQVSTQQQEQMQMDMLNGVCPIVGMTRCFDANPTECSKLKTDLLSAGSQSGAQTDGGDPIQAIEAQCKAKGISTVSAATAAMSKVTLAFKMNLDFAKVSSDEAVKDAITNRVRTRVLASMKGYKDSDLKITLKQGSVIAEVEISPIPGQTTDQLQSAATTASNTVGNNILDDVKAIPGIENVLSSGETKDELTVTGTVAAGTVGAGTATGMGMVAGTVGSYKVAVGGFMAASLVQLLL